MDADRFDDLLRSISGTPSRRDVARSLAGLALGGVFGLPGLAEVDAKGHKKKRRRRRKKRQKNRAFCAGKDWCDDRSSVCDDGSGVTCQCFVTAGSGKPFCGGGASQPIADCSECLEGQTCVDCAGVLACSVPCPNPR